MTLTKLYRIAEQNDIPVFSYDLGDCESLSLLDNKKCYIAIDPFMLSTSADEIVKLAHELGHCQTGAFYNEYSSLDIRKKHERRADKWAIKKLVPEDELKEIYTQGITGRYELAEHFGVTEDFMQKALDFYKQ